MAEIKEFFTVEELIDVLEAEGFGTTTAGSVDGEPMTATAIIVEAGGVSWCAALGDGGPFHDSVLLTHLVGIPVDPWVFADEWNDFHVFSTAVVMSDELLARVSEIEGIEHDFGIQLMSHITFHGGVTVAHLLHIIEQWHDDMVEIEDLVASGLEEGSPEHEFAGLEMPDLAEDADLLDQVAAFLAVAPDRSAREIARFYGAMKHEVNQVLYRHPDRFERRDGSPPRWSLRVDGLPGG